MATMQSQEQSLMGVNSAFKPTNAEQAAALARVNAAFAPIPATSLQNGATPFQTPKTTETFGTATDGNDQVASYLKQLREQSQQQYTDFASQLSAAFEQQGQSAAREQQLKDSTGYNQIAGQLNELGAIDQNYQAQLNQLDAQAQNAQLAQQGTATSEYGRAINLRDVNYNYLQAKNNVNISRSVNNARIALAQGQLANAQMQIQNALDLEFKPLQAKVDYLSKFAEINANNLSKDQTNELNYLISQRQAKIDEQKAEKDAIYNTMVAAQQNGAPNDVVTAIGNAKTREEALQAAGGHAADPLLAGQRTLQQLQIQKAQQDLGGGGDKLLSIADAKALGVPYGTTQSEAIAMGKTPGATGGGAMQLAQTKAKVDQLSGIATEGGLSSAVGTSFLTRAPSGFWGTVGKLASVVGIPALIGDAYSKLTGQQQNFIGDVEQLRSQLNLDALIGAKAQGATFGALSDQELRVLASSATKLGTWAIKDGDGNTVGYNTTETNFKKEIDKINNFAKLDYIIKGGDPTDVGAQIMNDGSIWSKNSDGTLTQIK